MYPAAEIAELPEANPAWRPTRQAPDPFATPPPLRADTEIQGNVLAGFNKDHQSFLFVRFRDLDSARGWLGELVKRVATNQAVTSFNERFSERRRNSGADPESLKAVWTNVSFTAAGLELLAPEAIADLRSHPGLDSGIQRWLDGAADPTTAQRVGDVDDSAAEHWVFGASTQPVVHAIVCVAADDMVDLRLELVRQRELAAKYQVSIAWEQAGDTLPQRARGHEHFGFKDGISQPGVRGYDIPDEARSGEVKGKPGTDLIAAGTFILGYPRDDEPAIEVPGWMFDGSFLVTRRLAQDVPGFWNGMATAYKTLPDAAVTDPVNGIPSADTLAARLVGRWRSGTPTDKAPVSDRRSSRDSANDNNFDFAGDPDGISTPACAHIRKVYPRSGAAIVDEAGTKVRRILRRGIPFGPPFEPAGGRGRGVDTKRGLVFQCYQASIEDQFIFLQEAWVNADGFPLPQTGKDAIIGLASTVSVPAGADQHLLSFAAFVTTEGSMFTLTPSMTTMRSLVAGTLLA